MSFRTTTPRKKPRCPRTRQGSSPPPTLSVDGFIPPTDPARPVVPGGHEFADLSQQQALPFHTMGFRARRYKLFGVLTTRTLPGDDLIGWSRERCGKSEATRDIMKKDLADG